MNIDFPTSNHSWVPIVAACFALAVGTPAVAQGQGRGPRAGSNVAASVVPLPAEQAKSLQFMREEEKLARDVYLQLYDKWQLTIFKNIAASEDRHFKSIGTLLARYNIADPAADKPSGVYSDLNLTALYAQLMVVGSQSAKDALEVGLLIEKTDIADLEKAIAESDRTDIKRVYTNLMNASYSHQEAFETNLELACNLGM